MTASQKDHLTRQLDAAKQQALYWKQVARQTGHLRLRESENLSAMIQALKATEARLVKEIDERQRYEEALQASEARFKAAAHAAYDLLYEWNTKNDSLIWFGEIDRMLGFKSGEVSQDINAWLALIHPQDRHTLEKAVESHRKSTVPIRSE